MSTARYSAKRTYGNSTRNRVRPTNYSSDTPPESSSPSRGDVSETEATTPITKRKRPLTELYANAAPPPKKRTLSRLTAGKLEADNNIKPKTVTKKKTKKVIDTMTQLHFSTDRSVLRSCALCGLSYTHGAPGDESLHRAHCTRIRKGQEWGKEEERELARDHGAASVVDNAAVLRDGEVGRIVSVKADCGGKIGQKVKKFLEAINEALSAPGLSVPALSASRAYIFLLREPLAKASTTTSREKMVGCVVAQRISTAMAIVPSATNENTGELPQGLSGEDAVSPLVHVEGNLYCDPQRLPTPMGVSRLFVSSAHRRKGIAQTLLDAAARSFIHGCALDPSKGEVAFSQPTSLGKSIMEKWGKGGVRIYEEDV